MSAAIRVTPRLDIKDRNLVKGVQMEGGRVLGRTHDDEPQEIRNCEITRDERVALAKRFDDEFAVRYFHEFLEYRGMTEQRFRECVDVGRSPHLREKSGNEWRLRHAVWMQEDPA